MICLTSAEPSEEETHLMYNEMILKRNKILGLLKNS